MRAPREQAATRREQDATFRRWRGLDSPGTALFATAAVTALSFFAAGCGEANRANRPTQAQAALHRYERRASLLVETGVIQSVFNAPDGVGGVAEQIEGVACRAEDHASLDHDHVADRFRCVLTLVGGDKSQVVWQIDGPNGHQVGSTGATASFDAPLGRLPSSADEAKTQFAPLAFAVTGARPSSEPVAGRTIDAGCNGPLRVGGAAADYACRFVFHDQYGGASGGTYRVTFACDGSADQVSDADDSLMHAREVAFNGGPRDCPMGDSQDPSASAGETADDYSTSSTATVTPPAAATSEDDSGDSDASSRECGSLRINYMANGRTEHVDLSDIQTVAIPCGSARRTGRAWAQLAHVTNTSVMGGQARQAHVQPSSVGHLDCTYRTENGVKAAVCSRKQEGLGFQFTFSSP